jgi:hypothetical protein
VSGLAIIAIMILYAHRSNLLSHHPSRGEAPPVLHQEPTR